MITEEMLSPVGKIFNPHSYRGELNVELDYDFNFVELKKFPFLVKIDGIPVPFFSDKMRGGVSGASFIKFRGIDSDISALMLSNKNLYMLKADLALMLGLEVHEIEALEEGYSGFKVVNANNNETIGYVEKIEEGVEYDYISVKKNIDGELIEIPFIGEFITEIEETEGNPPGIIRVVLPDGFLEI